jgi:hypothetical protein
MHIKKYNKKLVEHFLAPTYILDVPINFNAKYVSCAILFTCTYQSFYSLDRMIRI